MYFINDLAAIQAALAELGWKQDGARRSANKTGRKKTASKLQQAEPATKTG